MCNRQLTLHDRPFQSIGSYHAPVGHGQEVKPASNGDLSASGSA
jgi:hypothetical protein